ncbi:MAG: hypothetical protein GY842_14445 [bacterium]|nr:hypothetical protein [bacterium]
MATTHRRTRTNTWNKTKGSAGRSTTKSSSSRMNYTTLKNNWQQKINSYRTLYSQTQGTANYGRPSASTLNSFGNWINKGAVVQTVSAAQINRWSKTDKKCATATAAKNVLWTKFGKSPIKAVCKSKTGSYIVATTPVFKGKTFKFPR